jgi:hypothetical protein
MSELLRKRRRLNYISFHVSQIIITKRLHNLRNVKEGNVHRVAFQSPHCVLDHKGMVLVRRQEVCDSCYWVYRSPIEEILSEVRTASGNTEG